MTDEAAKDKANADLLSLLAKAAEDNLIVVFGPPGLTLRDIIEAMHGHLKASFMIIADEEQAVPGGSDLVN